MGVLDIFDVCILDVSLVSLNYFIDFLEILLSFPGDISNVPWRYVIGFLDIFQSFL